MGKLNATWHVKASDAAERLVGTARQVAHRSREGVWLSRSPEDHPCGVQEAANHRAQSTSRAPSPELDLAELRDSRLRVETEQPEENAVTFMGR